jgi:hypothetical protein
MIEQATVEENPKSAVVAGSVPHAVARAIRDEAATKDRSVSWVVNQILTEWYRRQPGAQVELKLVPETDERGGGR